MIKLEIPMENDEDIMNVSLSRGDVEHFLPQSSSDPIPDLILSATGRPRTHSGQSLIRETTSSSHHSVPENSNSVLITDTGEVNCASSEVNRTDVQMNLADQSIKSAIAKKRDSLRRSRQLHRTISDDGHDRYKRLGTLERENELVESSLENLEVASTTNECTKNVDINHEDEYTDVIISLSEQPTASEDVEVNNVEMQFLRTLKSGINRAVHSPLRTRKCDANRTNEETWC